MMTAKEINQSRDQLKKDILQLDHQINQLQTYYIEDTKEAGNLLRGFDNYISLKTSKIQSVKKQKVELYERMFSLSSYTSKTSTNLEESFSTEQMNRIDVSAANAPKRNRPRQGGKTKSGGKNVMVREENMEEEEEDSDSIDGEGGDDSLDESMGKSRQANKKKKINKIPNPRNKA